MKNEKSQSTIQVNQRKIPDRSIVEHLDWLKWRDERTAICKTASEQHRGHREKESDRTVVSNNHSCRKNKRSRTVLAKPSCNAI